MANSDSSAIVRFVEHVQAEPILDTQRPPRPDTLPTTPVEKVPRHHSLKGFFVTGLIAAALGVGGAFYLAESGGEQAATSARAGLAGVGKSEQGTAKAAVAEQQVPPEPTAAPVVLPAVEPEAEPAPAAAIPAPAAELDQSEAAPAVQEAPAVEAAPAVAEEPAESASPVVADEPAAQAAPVEKKKTARKAKRRAKKSQRATRSKKAKKAVASAGSGKGTLMLGAKPPCRIYIDGLDTGKMTPQRGIELPAGKHKVLLVNREYNIKSRATVTIEAGKKTRIVRDLSERIK